MSSPPAVAKAIWTDADFDQMGWHDNAIHAVAVEPAPPYPGRLLVDLDYILEWDHPTPPATSFAFWICPATLVFDHARDLTADIDMTALAFELSLADLERSRPR